MRKEEMKITKSQLKQIIKEELNEINWPWSKDKESGSGYRRRKRHSDYEKAGWGSTADEVPYSSHQVHVVALLNDSVVGIIKVEGPPGGYTGDEQMEDDAEINRAIRALKAKSDEVQVWQETGEDAPQFQRGGLAADPESIPGSMEQGVLIFSIMGTKV